MSEQRRRGRVPLPGVGWGIRASDGVKFEVRPVNYSIAGLLIEITPSVWMARPRASP